MIDRDLSLKKEISKNINRFMKEKGWTQVKLSEESGVSKSTISDYIRCHTLISAGNVQKIADAFKVKKSDIDPSFSPTNMSTNFVNNIEYVSPKTVLVPILGEISCGDPITAEENIIGHREEIEESLPSGKVFYLKSKGNSMHPTIPDNSYVLIKEQPEVEYGEIAAVLVNDDTEATLKRVKKQGDIVMLVPDNNEHEPYIITKDNPATILGKAIRYTQDL